jgi:uncharacterized protein (DUF302 family)
LHAGPDRPATAAHAEAVDWDLRSTVTMSLLRKPGVSPVLHLLAGLFVLALAGWLTGFRDDESAEYEVRLESAYDFNETISHLRSALALKGFTVMAVIDHSAAAKAVGLEMPPSTVLIYGNPKGGTPLMLATPDFALELPLRVLVREDASGKTYVVFNTADSLEGKHGLPSGMTKPLAAAEDVIRGAITGATSTAPSDHPSRVASASRSDKWPTKP